MYVIGMCKYKARCLNECRRIWIIALITLDRVAHLKDYRTISRVTHDFEGKI